MFNRKLLLITILHSLFCGQSLWAQEQEDQRDSISINTWQKLVNSLPDGAAAMEGKFDKTTQKYLSELQKQERKLQKKLWMKDSVLAKQLFFGIQEKYASLRSAPEQLSKYSSQYSPKLDSLTTALNFLNEQQLPTTKVEKALSSLTSLQAKLQHTEKVKQFLSERKRLLKVNMQQLGMLKELKGFQKQAYYYAQQVREYRQLLENPEGPGKKLLQAVARTEKFQAFFKKHSQLASLFSLPGANSPTASLQGLQTRASVQAAIQARFGSGANVQQLLQQNLQAAQAELSNLKGKLSQFGGGSYGNSVGDIELPEGFKPNTQKTKTFLQRLEYGANLQSQKSSAYFPTTSDVGLSLGYKLSDKSAVGVGASYKLGWGRGWNHLRLSSEGVGLRSYMEVKLKGSLYVSGGYEQNFRSAFGSIQQLQDYSAWQSSGLLGLSKRYQVSRKVKGDLKVLWDFLSYRQIPKTQAILFRIGYNLK